MIIGYFSRIMKSPDANIFTTPFNQLLGLVVRGFHRDGVTVEAVVRDEIRNAQGVLHGGVTATLVDVAVGMSIWHHFGQKKNIATVELKLNYFLPIVKGKVRARARLLRVGSSLAVGSVEVKIEGNRLAAFGIATYKILDDATPLKPAGSPSSSRSGGTQAARASRLRTTSNE